MEEQKKIGWQNRKREDGRKDRKRDDGRIEKERMEEQKKRGWKNRKREDRRIEKERMEEQIEGKQEGLKVKKSINIGEERGTISYHIIPYLTKPNQTESNQFKVKIKIIWKEIESREVEIRIDSIKSKKEKQLFHLNTGDLSDAQSC